MLSSTATDIPKGPIKSRCVLICQYRSCQRNHSEAVLTAFRAHPLEGVFIGTSDCMGQCSSGPTVQVLPDRTWYCQVKPEDVPQIIQEHLQDDRPVQKLLHPRFHPHFEP